MGSSRFNVRPKSSEQSPKVACPYCRDALAREAGALCATCLAVHHVECWRAHLRCASCGHSQGLLPPSAVKSAPVVPPPASTVKVGVRARCDAADAALLLGAKPHEMEWLVAKGHLQALPGGTFDREEVLALQAKLPRLRDLMNPARRPGFFARLLGP